MRKPLSDMTLEELWALFPIVLREHDPRYAGWFEEEAKNIRRCAGDASLFRLSQIGSSAVPGLLAKPIVDILLEVGGDLCGLSDRLQRDGWVFMAQTETPAGPKLLSLIHISEPTRH